MSSATYGQIALGVAAVALALAVYALKVAQGVLDDALKANDEALAHLRRSQKLCDEAKRLAESWRQS